MRRPNWHAIVIRRLLVQQSSALHAFESCFLPSATCMSEAYKLQLHNHTVNTPAGEKADAVSEVTARIMAHEQVSVLATDPPWLKNLWERCPKSETQATSGPRKLTLFQPKLKKKKKEVQCAIKLFTFVSVLLYCRARKQYLFYD